MRNLKTNKSINSNKGITSFFFDWEAVVESERLNGCTTLESYEELADKNNWEISKNACCVFGPFLQAAICIPFYKPFHFTNHPHKTKGMTLLVKQTN